uniref:Secreted protein n=1 Tax=Angiostrongylus cantonensis TaxID=6313 RepID=A0A0K0DHJ1_ANGCA
MHLTECVFFRLCTASCRVFLLYPFYLIDPSNDSPLHRGWDVFLGIGLPCTTEDSSLDRHSQAENDSEISDATTETCARIHRLASAFGISDVSNYARQNCRLLQLFASGFTCEQIIYFVNSCHKSLSYQQEKAK